VWWKSHYHFYKRRLVDKNNIHYTNHSPRTLAIDKNLMHAISYL
jgi:hypothetical protein